MKAILNALARTARGWNSSTTAAQAYSDAKPAIQALQGLTPKLDSVAPLSGDLTSLQTLNASDFLQWATQFLSDSANTKRAAAVVRADLGLPANGS